MFVRFRETKSSRLQCSLIKTCRTGGKVVNEHVASLGAVPHEPSIADRVEFWHTLRQRLDRLANRVDNDTRLKVLEVVNARIPMPTAADLRQGARRSNEAIDNAHLTRISQAEERTADALKELEVLHRAMASDPAVRELPLDPVHVAAMYFCRVLAARRMEALGALGVQEYADATGQAAVSVRLALDREEHEIARITKARRASLS